MNQTKTYLALGDSMSIDLYTGVYRGGAVSQFHDFLSKEWTLIDRTADGCTIDRVPTDDIAEIITLTIGGNDGLTLLTRPTEPEVGHIVKSHGKLLRKIRKRNSDACLIVGNIYTPALPLSKNLSDHLSLLNKGIEENVRQVGGQLADIHTAFLGHASEYLCHQIEPNFEGASVIAALFKEQYTQWCASNTSKNQ